MRLTAFKRGTACPATRVEEYPPTKKSVQARQPRGAPHVSQAYRCSALGCLAPEALTTVPLVMIPPRESGKVTYSNQNDIWATPI